MLEVSNLEVVYNEVILVLRGLSIVVPDGKIVALLGANGAGKTTTLRAISGLLDIHGGKITKGTVTLNGDRIDGREAAAIVRSGITQVMEGRRTFADLTVQENLACGAYTNRDKAAVKEAYGRVMDLFPRLAERRNQVAGYMSGGEQQMLAIGRALALRPKLLLVDELSMGLAPIIVERLLEVLRQVAADGTAILFVEQHLHLALAAADRAVVLVHGRVALEGSPGALLDDPQRLERAYLGEP
jgi:branched-chain amino acid transport system ATP-binding protein